MATISEPSCFKDPDEYSPTSSAYSGCGWRTDCRKGIDQLATSYVPPTSQTPYQRSPYQTPYQQSPYQTPYQPPYQTLQPQKKPRATKKGNIAPVRLGKQVLSHAPMSVYNFNKPLPGQLLKWSIITTAQGINQEIGFLLEQIRINMVDEALSTTPDPDDEEGK